MGTSIATIPVVAYLEQLMTTAQTGQWFGIPMDKLTRDELVGVITYLTRENQTQKVELDRMRSHVDWPSYLSAQTMQGGQGVSAP